MTEVAPPQLAIERPAPIIRADAVVSVAFERQDLGAMSRFLEDFGFKPYGEGAAGSQYFRTYGATPYAVEVRASSQDAFIGFALSARTREDLEILARTEGLQIEPIEGPGGGVRVRLWDPDGRRVDMAHGFAPVEPLPTRTASPPVNTPFEIHRLDGTVRTPLAPAPIFRLGHVVLQTADFQTTSQWYMRRFGFIPSDVLTLPDGAPALGFFRFDRGASPADHHSLAILEGPGPSLLHISTETLDIEAIGQGQQHLRARGWTHYWGIGRHMLGSQIFDYWKDSAGDEWEHYADGDVMTADYPTGYHALDRGGLWTWGDDLPDSMRPRERPPAGAPPKAHGAFEALSAPPRPWLL